MPVQYIVITIFYYLLKKNPTKKKLIYLQFIIVAIKKQFF